MRKKSLGILAFAAAMGAAGVAHAADLYVPQPAPVIYTPVAAYNWTGFYAGVSGGWGWGKTTASNGNDTKLNGGVLGAQAGYNWAFANNFVAGIEADINWSGQKGSMQTLAPDTIDMKLNWYGTVRGRLGYAYNNVLPYVTGGFAYGNATRTTTAGSANQDSQSHTGYTLGAGVEWAFAQNWTAKLEYQYVKLNAKTYNVTGAPSVGLTDNIVKVGLNYKF